MKIGFIGQGYIGKNYADDFESRGYDVIRYSLEDQFINNKEKIKNCEIVFIAVPTPTDSEGFDDSILINVLDLTSRGSIVVIKSTPLPGVTKKIQDMYEDRVVLYSPEFLRESSAAEDARHPKRNVIGIPYDDQKNKEAASKVMSILPKAPYEKITTSTAAEFLKYVSNTLPYVKIMFLNIVYDLCTKYELEWDDLKELLMHDPYISPNHLDPVHKSGRGAGGHCLIKDFAAFRHLYEDMVSDPEGLELLKSVERKNIQLLKASDKDLDLLSGVYGNELKIN